MQRVRWNSLSRFVRIKWVMTVAAIALAATAWATPPLGFSVNQILASGTATRSIHQHVELNKNPDGSVTPWELELEVEGSTDYYSQHLVLIPGGYSGWHSHPGLLVGAVKSGAIDFYDAKCRKRTLSAGQVFTENDNVHAIANTGAVDADLSISYLVKQGQPRRREESAPACAIYTGIP